MDESMVGIPVLAQKLVQIQGTIISKCLPDIVRKINDKLNSNVSELSKMPQNVSSVAEAMTVFFADELQKSAENKSTENFLVYEMRVLEEAKRIELPNFLPHPAFLVILQKKVEQISNTPIDFMEEVWNYIETVVTTVFTKHCENYPQLQSATRRAIHSLVEKMKAKSFDRVMEFVEMEKLTDYTCSPEYMSDWIGHLRGLPNVREQEQAFDMKMRITAYWKVVLKRLVDNLALHLQLHVRNLVDRHMEPEIVNELMGSQGGGPGAIQRMLEESPSTAKKRERLNKSIKLLKDSKEVVAQIMDRIALIIKAQPLFLSLVSRRSLEAEAQSSDSDQEMT
ncbi:hypothetical protein C3L33_08693, partial [Rhododendron williamsianum]